MAPHLKFLVRVLTSTGLVTNCKILHACDPPHTRPDQNDLCYIQDPVPELPRIVPAFGPVRLCPEIKCSLVF
ncbi:hypothetical protein F5146DRAFT_1057082 [Armillaria mellea]|nr:hypothetical protein F5146DRAFT_1057082 [Armillaria mellea]